MPIKATTTTSPLFSATLRPEGSMRAAGGWIGFVIAGIVGTPLLIAAPEFLLPGAIGFALAGGGLTALTMRQSRQARVSQQVTLWQDQLEITTISSDSERQMLRFAPKDVRLLLQRDDNERTTAMHLRHGQESFELGAFLKVDEKSSFARAFGSALRQARRP